MPPPGKVDISDITKLTHDREVSIRLYRSYRKKYPQPTPEWVVKKVVEDLLRDRGVRASYSSNKNGAKNFRFPKRKPVKLADHINQWLKGNSSNPWSIAILIALPTLLSQFIEYSKNKYQNFPPPNPYQQISAGAQVTMHNRTPETMTIRLEGAQNYEFKIEPCKNCSVEVKEEMGERLCNGPGPSLTIAVPPGVYEAKINFTGRTRGFKSQWYVQNQWEHYQCIFSLHDLGQ